MSIQTTLTRETICSLSAAFLLKRLLEEKHRGVLQSVIMPDLIGSAWPRELVPFYEMYGCREKAAGQQLGKLLRKQADILGLPWIVETRRGGKLITRYFFRGPYAVHQAPPSGTPKSSTFSGTFPPA